MSRDDVSAGATAHADGMSGERTMIEAGSVNDAGEAYAWDTSEWWPRGRYEGVPFFVEVPDA